MSELPKTCAECGNWIERDAREVGAALRERIRELSTENRKHAIFAEAAAAALAYYAVSKDPDVAKAAIDVLETDSSSQEKAGE